MERNIDLTLTVSDGQISVELYDNESGDHVTYTNDDLAEIGERVSAEVTGWLEIMLEQCSRHEIS